MIHIDEIFKRLEESPTYIFQCMLLDIIYQLEQIMKEKNIDADELAKKIGFSKRKFKKLLECDCDDISLLTLIKISNIIGYELSYIDFVEI